MFAFQEANLATVRSDRVNMILPKARNQMPTLKPKEKQLVEYLSKNMYIYIYIWVFPKKTSGTPKSSIFPYKPSILGVFPYFWTPKPDVFRFFLGGLPH